ncbi:hypothetical protein HRbin24_00137 [bacterium HR24]|nr:hypothetical protein HRbin24_00137 [bacterium HR24]
MSDEGQGRAVAALAASAFIFWAGGVLYFQADLTRPEMVALTLALYGCALALPVMGLAAPRVIWVEIGTWGALLLAVVSLMVHFTRRNPVYGTDDLALTHYAAEAVLHGINPYRLVGAQLTEEAVRQFGLSPQFLTRLLDGSAIDRVMSYPALHVVAFVPFVWLGLADLRWVLLGFELTAWAMLYLWSPARLRPLVWLPLMAELNLSIFFTQGAVTDWGWVPFAMASYRLLLWGRLVPAGISYGLACSFKQTPWLAAPFLLVWLGRQGHSTHGVRGRLTHVFLFSLTALATFLFTNLPFMVTGDPRDWAQGTFFPFIAPMVPLGSGPSLLTQLGLAPLPRPLYLAMAVAAAALAVAAYHLFFARLRSALWALPAIPLWFSYRSLHNYFVYWLPLAMLSLALECPAGGEPQGEPGRPASSAASGWLGQAWLQGPAPAAGLVAALGLTLLAATGLGLVRTQSRLELTVISVDDPWAVGAPTSFTVQVHNRSAAVVQPRFSLMGSPLPLPLEAYGPEVIAPFSSARYKLAVISPFDLPTILFLRLPGETGSLQVKEFALRVNDARASTFAVVRVSNFLLRDPGILNPNFFFWSPRTGTRPSLAPFRWDPSVRVGGNDEARAYEGEASGRHALALEVYQDGQVGDSPVQRSDEWAEAGLAQWIPFPCELALTVLPEENFRFVGEGWPTLAFGVQLWDGQHSLWVVFRDDLSTFYLLPTQTAVLVQRAPLHSWSEHRVNIDSVYRSLGWKKPPSILIRPFLAAHVDAPGRHIGYVARLEGSPAPSDGCPQASSDRRQPPLSASYPPAPGDARLSTDVSLGVAGEEGAGVHGLSTVELATPAPARPRRLGVEDTRIREVTS